MEVNLINAPYHRSLSLCSFYVTFLEQNHQLNHLPPADFYKICLWASSEFCRYYTEKTSPVTLTVFLINPLGNFPQTHTHTDFLVLLFVIVLHQFTFNFISVESIAPVCSLSEVDRRKVSISTDMRYVVKVTGKVTTSSFLKLAKNSIFPFNVYILYLHISGRIEELFRGIQISILKNVYRLETLKKSLFEYK